MSNILTIDRTKWLRGEGGKSSALLRESDGRMCCLGFSCISYGVSENNILGVKTTRRAMHDFPEIMEKLPEWMKYMPDPTEDVPTIILLLMEVNDDISISDEKREKKLTEIFSRVGVKIQFIN